MYKIQLQIKMKQLKYLIYIVLVIALNFSCSEDDTVGNQAPENSFLSNFDDTFWESEENWADQTNIMYRFTSNVTNPYETFELVTYPYNCIDRYRNFVEAPFWYENLEIIENTENSLVMSYTNIESDSPEPTFLEFTLNSSGNSINIRRNSSDAPEDNLVIYLTAFSFNNYVRDCPW